MIAMAVLVGVGNPIIFITAFPEERIRSRVLEAGAIGFLSKPFDEANAFASSEDFLLSNRIRLIVIQFGSNRGTTKKISG
jgi:FixJ family two-component response regulator